MAEPLERGLRAARPGGLTSPEPVRTLTPARARLPPTPTRNHGQAAQQAGGGTNTPPFTCENPSSRKEPITAAPGIQPVDPGSGGGRDFAVGLDAHGPGYAVSLTKGN
jgi:hypothetical protein